MTKIQYENLTIRQAVAADAKQLAAWWNDGAVMAHAGFPNGTGQTVRQVKQELRADRRKNKQRLILEREHRAVGEMMYQISESGAVEIGIKICPQEQNHGLGRYYCSMLCAWLFGRGVKSIFLTTDWENRRAQHVYEALGFRRTGVFPNAFTDPQGVAHTAVRYDLTPSDFQSVL